MSRVQWFRNPFKRTLVNVTVAGTTVVIAAPATGISTQVYAGMLNLSGGGTVDLQTTGGVSLWGGPWTWSGCLLLPVVGPTWFLSPGAQGVQIVAAGTVTLNGWIDYLQQIDMTQPAGT